MTTRQITFILETMKALQNKARIGKAHYTVSITAIEMRDIIKSLDYCKKI